MDEKTNFIVYCIEEYKNAKGMNGKSVIDLFNRYRVIDYIRDYYEALPLPADSISWMISVCILKHGSLPWLDERLNTAQSNLRRVPSEKWGASRFLKEASMLQTFKNRKFVTSILQNSIRSA